MNISINMRKIKIKKLGGPLYGQTKDGGLDDNQRIEKKEPSGINHVVKEVSRKKANVELEDKEIVFKPDSNTLQIVKGKTHEQGGVPADLQPGTFVFSDHLKLGGEASLIPGAKPGQTFAAALMKDVKPFNEAINTMVYSKDNDTYKQNAAELTISETIKKLKNLAMLQELQKGLKDGVPEFIEEDLPQAKHGGLIKMQMAGTYKEKEYDVNGRKVKAKNVTKDKIPQGAKEIIKDELYGTSSSKGQRVDDGRVKISGRSRQPTYEEGLKLKDSTYKTFFNKKNWINAPEDEARKAWEYTWQNKKGERPAYKPSTQEDFYYLDGQPAPKPGEQPKPVPIPGGQPVPGEEPKKTGTKTYTEQEQQQQQQTDEQPEEVGYGYMDAISVLSPFTQRYNKQYPILQQVKAPNIKFRPVDFEQERQRILGTSNTLGNFNNVYSPSASMASARNSMLLGEATEGVNQSFQKEFNTNQLGFQEFDMKNAESAYNAELMNANFFNTYRDQVVQTNTNFDAAMNMRDKEVLKNFYAAERQRVMKNLFNKTATDFNVDANYNIRKLNRPNATAARITGEGGGSGEDGISFEQFKAKAKAKAPYLTDEELQKAYGDATMRGQLKQNQPNQSSGDFERLQQMMQQ